jgi:hypothetical protein
MRLSDTSAPTFGPHANFGLRKTMPKAPQWMVPVITPIPHRRLTDQHQRETERQKAKDSDL